MCAFPLGIFKPFFVVEHIITLVTLKSVITGKKIVCQNTYEVGIFRFFVHWLALMLTETVLRCVSTFSVVLPSSSWKQWSPDMMRRQSPTNLVSNIFEEIFVASWSHRSDYTQLEFPTIPFQAYLVHQNLIYEYTFKMRNYGNKGLVVLRSSLGWDGIDYWGLVDYS